MLSTVLLISLSGQSYSWSCGASTAAAPRPAIVATRPVRRSAAPRAAASVRPINVAIVGGGTVGGGIVEILSEKAPFMRDALYLPYVSLVPPMYLAVPRAPPPSARPP